MVPAACVACRCTCLAASSPPGRSRAATRCSTSGRTPSLMASSPSAAACPTAFPRQGALSPLCFRTPSCDHVHGRPDLRARACACSRAGLGQPLTLCMPARPVRPWPHAAAWLCTQPGVGDRVHERGPPAGRARPDCGAGAGRQRVHARHVVRPPRRMLSCGHCWTTGRLLAAVRASAATELSGPAPQPSHLQANTPRIAVLLPGRTPSRRCSL